MANHSTILLVVGTSDQLIFAADSQALTSTNELATKGAKKLCLWEPSSACAIGGFCEGTIKEGPRMGKEWKLMSSLAGLHLDETTDPLGRANQVFKSAHDSCADYFPNDTDPFTLGTVPNGVVVLYGEMHSLNGPFLMRADFPVTVQEKHLGGFAWSVGEPNIQRVYPNGAASPSAFLYFHDPEHFQPIEMTPPEGLGASFMESLMIEYSKQTGKTMGGTVKAIALRPGNADWLP